MPDFKLGRIKNDPTKLRLRLTAAPASYTPPPSLDYYSAVPKASWGMDGNDELGDCTIADVDHEVKSDQVVAGNVEVQSTTAECVSMYSKITGYTPGDPNSDQGAQMQDVRTYWRKNGFTLGGKTDKIAMFAELKVTDLTTVKWALDRMGTVGIGFNFPNSAMDQFNAGQPWDVVKGEPEPTEGHAVALLGYDSQYAYVGTWGTVQKMTWAFWAEYVEEAWLGLSQDFVSAKSGTDEFGETLYQLGQQFANVTGLANPVPNPSPSPTPAPPPLPPGPAPAPSPTPGPDYEAVLTALLGAVPAGWENKNHIGDTEKTARAVEVARLAVGLPKAYPYVPEHLA